MNCSADFFLFTTAHQRPLPQPALPPFNSNTFPSRTTKPAPKHSLPGTNSMPGSFAGSNLSASSSLPPNFSQGHINRSFSRGAADGRSLPPPNKQFPRPPSPEDNEDSMNEEWYVSYITRPEAEAALRKINQDGTFLVRDSTKKTVTHPYVLMVLYKNKVYNIQIRYQEQSQVYLLGTGLRGKEVNISNVTLQHSPFLCLFKYWKKDVFQNFFIIRNTSWGQEKSGDNHSRCLIQAYYNNPDS
uniref:SH2 domain-containing protein n=1 Tax=Ornithorhynchus anatinus TaxID=9258 RepID=A0A6I8N3C1_ORNAN